MNIRLSSHHNNNKHFASSESSRLGFYSTCEEWLRPLCQARSPWAYKPRDKASPTLCRRKVLYLPEIRSKFKTCSVVRAFHIRFSWSVSKSTLRTSAPQK